jgi:hypothetical protein
LKLSSETTQLFALRVGYYSGLARFAGMAENDVGFVNHSGLFDEGFKTGR